MGGTCSAYGGERILLGNLDGNKPVGRHRRRLGDYMKMDFQEVGFGGMG
jgi:hypothetical protein